MAVSVRRGVDGEDNGIGARLFRAVEKLLGGRVVGVVKVELHVELVMGVEGFTRRTDLLENNLALLLSLCNLLDRLAGIQSRL